MAPDKIDSISGLLSEREKRYGSFSTHAEISQHLKDVVFHAKPRHLFKRADQVEALEMICHKIARVINGDEDYEDNWTDIAGYAKLIADRLKKEV